MRLLIVVSLLLALACSDIEPKETSAYFSLDSLVDAQLNVLSKGSLSLEKTAYTLTDTSRVTFKPDSSQWADEMSLFRTFNINKPALIGQYSITERPDKKSNLMVQRYEANEEDMEVQLLELYYLEDLSDLKIIRSTMREDNAVFTSMKRIHLQFDKLGGTTKLKSYRIQGAQKMVLQDSASFVIKGRVIY